VAVIQSKVELGAFPSLYGKPAQYAKFLGTELETLYAIGLSRAGRKVTVRYFLSDDSGRVGASVTVDRGTSVLTTVRVPLHVTSLMRAERTTVALASDPSGNRSRRSCRRV
jgi:hypothetical protein